jgi:hypothetical protein
MGLWQRRRSERDLARTIQDGSDPDVKPVGWTRFESLLRDGEIPVVLSPVAAVYADSDGGRNPHMSGYAALTDRALLLSLVPPHLERWPVVADRVDWSLMSGDLELEEEVGVSVAYARPDRLPAMVKVALAPRKPEFADALLDRWAEARRRREREVRKVQEVVVPLLPDGELVEMAVPVLVSEAHRWTAPDPECRDGFIALTEQSILWGAYRGTPEETIEGACIRELYEVDCWAAAGEDGFHLVVVGAAGEETVRVLAGHPDDVWPLDAVRRELEDDVWSAAVTGGAVRAFLANAVEAKHRAEHGIGGSTS